MACAISFEPPPFSTYQPILNRMPFGDLPVGFDPNAANDALQQQQDAQAKAEQQALARQINMSAVNITPDGYTAIGFTDLSVKPPLSHYLRVGEKSDGWHVLNADYDEEIATLIKDDVTITLKLGIGLIDTPSNILATASSETPPPAVSESALPPAAPPALAARTSATPPRFQRTSPGNRLRTPAAETSSGGRSYADRLRERTAKEAKEEQEKQARMNEQFKKIAEEIAEREIKRREEEEEAAAEVEEVADEPPPPDEEPAEPDPDADD